jgi:adenylate cyclase
VTRYCFGRFSVDLRSACLRCDETPVPLRPKSFDVLLYLVLNRGRIVSKNELLDGVWANVSVTENSLVQCIMEIRQALNDDQQQTIQTVSKRGYLFAPTVIERDDTTAAAAVISPAGASPLPAPMPNARDRWMALSGLVLALLFAGGAWWWWTADRQPPAAEPARAEDSAAKRLSIAVLPFSRSDSTADDYFSTGIAEDISTALGRFSELSVVTPNLVVRARSAGASASDAGRRLKARYLVEGSVRQAPDRIRVAVRLSETANGQLLWSESYDAPAGHIIAIEDDIVIRIAGALAVKLANVEQNRVAGKSVGSMEAYDLVLRGRELLTRLNRTSHSNARKIFERAIALDANYAPAYVGLGRVDLSAVALGWTSTPAEALKRAQSLAQKAISIDEFSPAAHVLLGRTYARLEDYKRAIDVLKHAVALNPSNPDSHAGLGDALLWNGQAADAIAALETALAMDPRLSAEDLFSLGAAYFINDKLADSLRVFERATTRNEGNPFIFAMLAALYAEKGREAESRTAVAELRKLNPFFDAQNFGSLFKQPQDRYKIAAALKKAGL